MEQNKFDVYSLQYTRVCVCNYFTQKNPETLCLTTLWMLLSHWLCELFCIWSKVKM